MDAQECNELPAPGGGGHSSSWAGQRRRFYKVEAELDDVKIPPPQKKNPDLGVRSFEVRSGIQVLGTDLSSGLFALSILDGVSGVEQATERKV